MLRRTTSARTAPAVLVASLGLALIAAVAPASAAPDTSGSAASAASPASAAAPSALRASGPFAAAADVSLLTVDIPSLSPSILPLTNVDLARSQANVESDADLDPDKAGAQRTEAIAGTTGSTSVLDTPIELQVNQASAPPPDAGETVLLPLDLEPLLNVPVIRTNALANWISDTQCVAADTPLSLADQALADLTLLGGEAIGGGSVAELNTEDAEGAADAEASTYLAAIDGPGSDQRAIQARVRTDVSSLNVLNGLAGPGSAISADVVQNPNWVVSASGLPGGASVTGPDPAVNVSVGGDDIITLVSGNDPVPATLLDLNLLDLLDQDTETGFLSDLLTDLGLEALIPIAGPLEDGIEDVLVTLSPVALLDIPTEIVEAPDGTFASVTGSLLRVRLLAPDAPTGPLDPIVDEVINAILEALGAAIDEPLLTIQVAPYGASAEAPVGGITCGDDDNPLRELNKHASAAEVAPGGEFDYNISVPNRGPCALTDVVVTDVVTGPAGFEIVETEPQGTVNGGQVSFDVGDLAANETVNLRIRIRVPADAADGATFDDVVTASGNCDGRQVTEDDRLDDVPVVRRDFSGDCNVQFSNKDASHIQVFPGQTFSYYVHAFNAGGEPCNNVRIVDTLDDRLAFVSCNRNCTNDPANTVTWTLDRLPAGSSAVLAVVVQVDEDATGTLENSAVISPEGHPSVTVRTRGPVIGPDSIPKDPASPSRRPLPRTGSMVPTGLAAGLGLGAIALFALRRRMTA